MIKLFFPTLLVILFYIIYDLYIIKVYSLNSIMLNVITGNYYNLWYMYMLLGMYILIPVIIRYKEQISIHAYKLSAIISQSNSSYLCGLDLGVVMSYVSYLMIGDILYTNLKNKSNKKLIISLLFAVVLCGITVLIRYMGYTKYLFDAYIGFFSPTIYLSSIYVFHMFLNIRLKVNLSFISSLTLYIYIYISYTCLSNNNEIFL